MTKKCHWNHRLRARRKFLPKAKNLNRNTKDESLKSARTHMMPDAIQMKRLANSLLATSAPQRNQSSCCMDAPSILLYLFTEIAQQHRTDRTQRRNFKGELSRRIGLWRLLQRGGGKEECVCRRRASWRRSPRHHWSRSGLPRQQNGSRPAGY